MKKILYMSIFRIKYILYIFLFIFGLVGCKTSQTISEVPVDLPQTHTEYVFNHDSVWVHDSIFTMLYISGDTVYKDKFVLKEIYKSKTDTIHTTDSITKPVYLKETITVTKEKELNWFQKMLQWLGVILIIYFGVRIYIKLKDKLNF